MRKLAFHAVRADRDLVGLDFAPMQAGDFLAAATGQKAEADDASIILSQRL